MEQSLAKENDGGNFVNRLKAERCVATRRKQLERGKRHINIWATKTSESKSLRGWEKHRTTALYLFNLDTDDLTIKVMPSTLHDSAAGVIQNTMVMSLRNEVDTLPISRPAIHAQ